jgi:hypothetical protein
MFRSCTSMCVYIYIIGVYLTASCYCNISSYDCDVEYITNDLSKQDTEPLLRWIRRLPSNCAETMIIVGRVVVVWRSYRVRVITVTLYLFCVHPLGSYYYCYHCQPALTVEATLSYQNNELAMVICEYKTLIYNNKSIDIRLGWYQWYRNILVISALSSQHDNPE